MAPNPLYLPTLQVQYYCMLNRQFEGLEPPTFAMIGADMRCFEALLTQAATTLSALFRKEPYAQTALINQEIAKSLRTLSDRKQELNRRISFFDTETEAQTVIIRPLKEMMKLPPMRSRLVEGDARRRRTNTSIKREKHRGPYRSYTLQEKNHVVELSHSGMSFAAISKSLEIPQKNVVRWCREGFNTGDPNRRIADSQMEESLAAWIVKTKRFAVLRQVDIQMKARELSTNPQFKASRGWLKNFMRRLGIRVKEEESIKMEVKKEEAKKE